MSTRFNLSRRYQARLYLKEKTSGIPDAPHGYGGSQLKGSLSECEAKVKELGFDMKAYGPGTISVGKLDRFGDIAEVGYIYYGPML